MIEAMKQALEVYCKTLHPLWNTRISRTEAEGFFEAGFKAAIAEAEKQEPVGYVSWGYEAVWNGKPPKAETDLYTHPQPKREWVGLTDEEVVECWARRNMFHIAHAIEAKLKEKNT